MALVSGQTVSSFAELNTMPAAFAEFNTSAEDSDDEYAYVSSLAEQIAHALMLEDDEEPQPSPALQPEVRHHYQGPAWTGVSILRGQEIEATSAEMLSPVSNFAAAWRDNGPSEWDCFYTPASQQTSRQLSSLYTSQLELKCNRLFREWNAARLAHDKQAAAFAPKMWESKPQEPHSSVYHSSSLVPKESIGTGVFLPKIMNSGPYYRRKAGFLPSRSAYAPRHKC